MKLPSLRAAGGATTLTYYNMKMTNLAGSGMLQDAIRLFDEMTPSSVVSLSSIIFAYDKSERSPDVRHLSDSMLTSKMLS